MRPTNKAELAHWIRQQLGEPVISTSELDPAQLENCIEHAIDYYGEFGGGIGHEQQYCVIQTHTCQELQSKGLTVTPISGTPYSFCDPTLTSSFLDYKQEYQLPKSVVAVTGVLPPSNSGNAGSINWLTYVSPGKEIIEAGMNVAESMSQYGTSFGGGSFNNINNTGMFFPGMYYSGGPYGSRGGSRESGWGADIVTMELGRQYIEMINQQFRIKVTVQFLEAQRKVRISPPIGGGTIVIGVWAKVPDASLYDNLFVKRYTLALAKMQFGGNVLKYENMKLPGGVTINGKFYYDEGKEEKKELEEDLESYKYNEPNTPFYIG